ncbi:hypothetical protein TKK_0017282 [Trichogramma kaykai]
MLCRKNRHAVFLDHLLSAYNLHIVNATEPTHHVVYATDGSLHESCIDLCMVRDVGSVIAHTKSLVPFAAGHDLSRTLPPPPSRFIRSWRNVTPAAVDAALSPLLSVPTSAARNNDCSLEPLVSAITTAIISAADSLAPLRPVRLTAHHKPWVDCEVRRLMHDRDRAYRRFRRCHRHSDLVQYRALRAEVRSTLDAKKNMYYAAKMEDTSSPTALWRTLRILGVLSSGFPSPLHNFTADTLAHHYASTSSRSPPLSPEIIDIVCTTSLPENWPAFTLQPITAPYITKLITEIASKSMGMDGISLPMLTLASSSLSTPLASLFNTSIATATFPHSWKLASIIPQSKTSSPSSPNDTRPIALLSELSKLLERVVHIQLTSYLINHDILSPHQHGFRPCDSTQTAILDITERVRSAIDGRMVSVLVSFDFSKAFDTIPHHHLLLRLREIGCDDAAIRWFADYLSLRNLAVRNADGTHSHYYRTTSGVPQGSVLGPLLFLIYINNLPSILSHTHAIIFADDTQIIAHPPPSQFSELVANIGVDANAVHQWAIANGLSLNTQKTCVLLHGSRIFTNALYRAGPPRITLAGTLLEYSPAIKILGVVLNSTLNWDSHISSISSKVHYSLYSLRYHRHSLSCHLRQRLVQALILPHLDYAAAVLTSLMVEQELRLQRLQNACIRFIYGNIPKTAHVTPYRLALGWLSVKRRRDQLMILQARKIIISNTPSCLATRFRLLEGQDPTRRVTRQLPPRLDYPSAKTSTLHRSFTHTTTKLINSIPSPFSLRPNTPNPRSLLRNHFLSLEKTEWLQRCETENLTPIPLPLTSLLSLTV